jgi:hypothetical protein
MMHISLPDGLVCQTILVGDSFNDADMAEGTDTVFRVRVYDPRTEEKVRIETVKRGHLFQGGKKAFLPTTDATMAFFIRKTSHNKNMVKKIKYDHFDRPPAATCRLST